MDLLDLEEQPTIISDIRKHAIEKPPSKRRSVGEYVVLVLVALYVIVSSYFIVDTRSRLASAMSQEHSSMARIEHHQQIADESLRAANELWAQRLGLTVQQLQQQLQQSVQSRAADFQRQQRVLEERVQLQNEQLGRVTVQVADVRGELGGARKAIADTRTDLESTKLRLDRAVGDLTGQSSLIARTREDLERLRHRGDREYYEFTLYKGTHAVQVSTVRLQLKKADAKKSKFTLAVTADHRVVEKKDRGAGEPLQFYTGRDRLLYEVVIFTVEKNKVTGYLSTPKSAALLATQ